jgi:hypothetical protein
MGWLIAGLLTVTFGSVLFAGLRIGREQRQWAASELSRAAARFGLQFRSTNRWTGMRTFGGNVQDFDLSWRFTPERGGKIIEVRIAHPALSAGSVPEEAQATLSAGPYDLQVTRQAGALTLGYKDRLGDDMNELVRCTRELLTLAVRIRGNQVHE